RGQDHLQLLGGAHPDAATRDGPHLEPCRRPALRALLLPAIAVLDMARTREVFEASTDFTLSVEEEFQLLDPETLSLTQRYSELKAATEPDAVLADAVAGELIESEIEIRSGRCESWAEVVARQQEARNRLFRIAG